MSNILGELKRRNVFKVATIYVVVSWLVLQVATAVFPLFEIPIWASRLIVVLLGLGFPFALIMAWAFDLTPDGIQWQDKSGESHVHTHAWDWVLAVLLSIAIGLMVSSQIEHWGRAAPAKVADADETIAADNPDSLPPPTGISGAQSIAVLPFRNVTNNPSDAYIGDGLSEELLSVLGRVPELKVASRTSTAYFKGKEIDNATIARTLMVENIVSGSVLRVGERLRVTAALDHSATGQLLWTETFDRTIDDILEIQSDIARAVASAVVPVLSPESEGLIIARATTSSAAYDFYLRGRDYLRQPTETSTLKSAIELFDRAIDLDARFAEAHAGLCDANLRSYEFTLDSGFFEHAELSCHRALTLDGDLWEVRVALGNLYFRNDQNRKAIAELEAAVEQKPDAVNAYLSLAGVYAAEGRLDEAERNFKHAESVESGYWGVHRLFGHFYYDQSRYADAIDRYKKVAELAPDNSSGFDNLGNTYLAIGELELAEEALNAALKPSRFTYTNRGLVYYYQGKYSQAIDDQSKAIELGTNDHRAWGRLADSYRHSENADEKALLAYLTAIDLAEEELLINPSSWESVARLGLYFVHAGRAADAEAQIEKSFNLTADSTAYYFASIVMLELGNRDKALVYFAEAVERGFSKVLLRIDPDLEALRKDAKFNQTLGLR